MSKETRTVRPFVGLDGLAGVLDEAVLRFGQDTCLGNRGITVDVSPHEFLLRPVLIEWGSDDEAFDGFAERIRRGADAAGLRLDDIALVVVASSSFVKTADVVLECSRGDLLRLPRISDLTAETRPTAFRAPFNGFTVDAYLVLARSLPRRPLRPYLRGTWLASVRFRIETTQVAALLPPTPLTDEIRERHRLPAKTIRYLYFGDHDLLMPYREQEQPVFYVDEKLLAQMNARRRSPPSKALQLQLAHDFVSAVIRRASATPELDGVAYDDLRTSLLGSVIRIAAGPGASDADRDRLVSQVRDDPDYVMARAEHAIDLAAGYGDLLKDGDE